MAIISYSLKPAMNVAIKCDWIRWIGLNGLDTWLVIRSLFPITIIYKRSRCSDSWIGDTMVPCAISYISDLDVPWHYAISLFSLFSLFFVSYVSYSRCIMIVILCYISDLDVPWHYAISLFSLFSLFFVSYVNYVLLFPS